jgi:prepilin signal peptidase PulO-like enzyme (type II secretory pathway)
MLMEQLFIYAALIIFGLALGSFAGATVWRLRARQLVQDKSDGETYDKKEYKTLSPLAKVNVANDRSRCLHCGHTLAWYDLIPLISWVSTGGKCRYCHKTIGWFEPLMELGTAAFFAASYALWPDSIQTPLEVIHFGLWLVAGVILAILFAYDLRWFLLPNKAVFPLIAVGALVAIIQLSNATDVFAALISLAIACVVLSGLYLLIWLVSKGQWIGFGDVKLGLGLALLLGDYQLAIVALFAANFVGCLIVIPGMISGKLTRTTRVPFGPLLIVGFVIAGLWGHSIVNAYTNLLLFSS